MKRIKHLKRNKLFNNYSNAIETSQQQVFIENRINRDQRIRRTVPSVKCAGDYIQKVLELIKHFPLLIVCQYLDGLRKQKCGYIENECSPKASLRTASIFPSDCSQCFPHLPCRRLCLFLQGSFKFYKKSLSC